MAGSMQDGEPALMDARRSEGRESDHIPNRVDILGRNPIGLVDLDTDLFQVEGFAVRDAPRGN